MKISLVDTIKEKCRVCYTCVRECPAKAIKISNGQAEIIQERCIGCGNCVLVCSQGAKVFIDSKKAVFDILESLDKVYAIIAPSFPAEFTEIGDYEVLVGMIKKLGFSDVYEVAFGADLVANKYKDVLENKSVDGQISSDCPAIVSYVEKYHPKLVDKLAPIVSPMVAMCRVLRKMHGNEAKIVFVGPCIAKKNESDEIDAVVTFRELREMLDIKEIKADINTKCDFSEPKAGKGAIFPITRGLIQTVDIPENLYEGNLIVAEGKTNFLNALDEFENGLINSPHLELLCCEGCIMGPGTTSKEKRYARRQYVSNYANKKLSQLDKNLWEENFLKFKDIDLTRSFAKNSQVAKSLSEDKIMDALRKMGKYSDSDHLNCGACGYTTCRKHAMAIVDGLAEIEMCLPYTIENLHKTVKDLAVSNNKLVSVQQALKQSEKLAHMGQLSAGIAHELNNPLGVVLMYSNILLEECETQEMKDDLNLIAEQADRCKKIVGGLLNFARKNQLVKEEMDLLKLIQQSLHSIIIPKTIHYSLVSELADSMIFADSEQMIQVISNLIKNAIESMTDGGELLVRLFKYSTDEVCISIKDTGKGIAKQDMEKIFEPFFTTKGIGKGTGLGLATAYGIVKMHNGRISILSNNEPLEGPTGTEFQIYLPFNKEI